ncbi:MAG: AI-2E family transporter [Gammaproteobacteria bacterium]|nr:AI-2E family transporter [Gammaproteobacteria bacterium]
MNESGHKASKWLPHHGGRILVSGVALALLYFGRSVLIPLVLAIMLSLLLAPAVRALGRIGLGRALSVSIVVLSLVVSCATLAVSLGTQVLRMTESLPRYEATIHRKIRTLDESTLGRVRVLTSEAGGLISMQDPVPGSRPANAGGYAAKSFSGTQQPTSDTEQPVQLARKLLKAAWTPLQGTGIVLLVLIFVLLEHESLRDRFIRIVGPTDIRATTLALNDAGERLSRYFVSQTLVNLLFGVAIWAGLRALGVPQAMLWGALAAVMRFVPYVGVALVALCATVLSVAVDPGWSLAAGTLALFIVLDVVVAQLLEPRLFGHATGLSPLAVVVAGIFWSSLWGPAGLVLSTPLTLCLLVAGRHIKALGALELLLGDVPSLTLPQKFYQRALAGDPHEIIANARSFLKSHSLARYCDRVLLPALHLAKLDAEQRASVSDHDQKIRRVIIQVVNALIGQRPRRRRSQHQGAVLHETSAGRWLRQQREHVSGKWQGPLDVPKGSVLLSLGLGTAADDLAAELLVRLWRTAQLDGRHFSADELHAGLPPGADPEAVTMVVLVSAFPGPERRRSEPLHRQVQQLFPRAQVVRLFSPGVIAAPADETSDPATWPTVDSLEEAVALGLSGWQKRPRADAPMTPALADVA